MERKSFKWMIVDLMFMYIVTGLGLILMAFLMVHRHFCQC